MNYSCDCNPRFSSSVEKLDGFKSFNIPAVKTCPGRTEICEASCYATKGRFVFPDVQAMYEANLAASKCECFVDRMVDQLMFTDRVVRIHASGDFYNAEYFMKWAEIARRRPDITFYAYTRNTRVRISRAPGNMMIYFSIDSSTEKVNPTARRWARIIDVDKSSVEHMQEYSNGRICTSDNCASCGYCFMQGGNVYFPQKYKKYVKELMVI